MLNIKPATIEDVQELLRGPGRFLPVGQGTKPALSTPPAGITPLDLSGVTGVVAYDAEEFTFTARAGTPAAEIQAMLAENGQYLAFDPPLAARGATLGGTVAAGMSGPGRYRFGGVRDFLLGARYVDGQGRLVRSGGAVVKNVAGFDLHKPMIGSLGRFGALVEVSFKVFPRPEAYGTLKVEYAALETAIESVNKLNLAPLDLDAVDLEPAASGAILWLRIGGLSKSLLARMENLQEFIGSGSRVAASEEPAIWQRICEFKWVPDGWSLVKVPLTPDRIQTLESLLGQLPESQRSQRFYSGGGQVGWVALPALPTGLDGLLQANRLSGLVLFGSADRVQLGSNLSQAFARRIKAALDPTLKFMEV